MKNTPFIQELVEARLYKGESTLKGKTAKEIASIVFLMIMTLEILRHESPSYAKKYVENTFQFGEFNSMRSVMSDLGNLLAVLSNQKDYDNTIKADFGINIPFLQLKRYLMDMKNGNKTSSVDKTFFLKLEDFLKVNESLHKTIRRYVTNWDTTQAAEKKNVVEIIKREFNTRSNYNDIYLHLKSESLTFK